MADPRVLVACAVLALGCAAGKTRPVSGALLIGSRLMLYQFPDMATCRTLMGQVEATSRADGTGRIIWSCEQEETDGAR